MAARFEVVGQVLGAAEIKFIVIGGWAAVLLGSVRTTLDVDVVYGRDRENIRRLAAALAYLLDNPAAACLLWRAPHAESRALR